MKTLQAQTNSITKRRGYRFWLGCLTLLLAMPVLFYYGYCWGLLGRHSLLLQYLFQCNCPAASEEARYPKEVVVIISACRYGSSILSPSGRLLAVYEKEPVNVSPYLLDLETGEKIPLPLPENGRFYFLTDNLLYISFSYEDNYILDRTNGDQYAIQRFLLSRPDAYLGGDVNPTLLAEVLRQAKYVFFRDQDDSIVALDPNFPTSTENSFLIDRFDIPGENPNRTEQFLKEYNIIYETILPYSPDEVLSPDRRFVARPDGIYLLKTGQKIVEGYSASNSIRGYSGKYFFARGWAYDGKSVIYSKFLNPCLIEVTFIGMDGYTCYIEVPQPVLKLKVPEEYLLPRETP